MGNFFNYIAWPVTTGLIVGLIVLLSQQPNFSLLPAPTATQVNSYADAVSRAAPAVVNIYTRKRLDTDNSHLRTDPLFRRYLEHNQSSSSRLSPPIALGSGVIVRSDGYLLTNNHVIAEADDILVLLHDGREARARLIGTDPDSDLAVLKIDLKQLNAIELGNPTQAQVGDVVLAIGNPFEVGQTVTQGIISATGRYGLGLNTYENFLQTDAAINPGNSGGALVDSNGRLLGINTAVLDKNGQSSQGISFAIPADTAMKALNDIIQYGTVVRGWLGIEARQLTPQLASSLGTDIKNGLLITGIYNRGPAHIAGVHPGDIVIAINDKPIVDGRVSMYEIAGLTPGTAISLSIARGPQLLKLRAIISARPARQDN